MVRTVRTVVDGAVFLWEDTMVGRGWLKVCLWMHAHDVLDKLVDYTFTVFQSVHILYCTPQIEGLPRKGTLRFTLIHYSA